MDEDVNTITHMLADEEINLTQKLN